VREVGIESERDRVFEGERDGERERDREGDIEWGGERGR
jgi:hypothetical protein